MPEAPPKFARIVVNLALDRTFDYRIPDQLLGRVHIGSRVIVPFGHSRRSAFVTDLPKSPATGELKEIESVVGERTMIPDRLMELGHWMADYYCCSREQAIHALLPAVVRQGKISQKTHKTVRLNSEVDLAEALNGLRKNAKRQVEALKLLSRCHTCSLTFLAHEAGIGAGTVRSLAEKGLVAIEEEVAIRDPFAHVQVLPTTPLPLTGEQAAALAEVRESFADEKKHAILLHGVTGSGKTEVYLQAIADCVEAGQEAIVLVPEIALTPQTVERFRGRFGDQVSVLHSHLSDGERFDEWTRINEGKVKIVVGARSAVFAPFRHLGLIVVDEEHENTYKQTEQAPCYHARDVAVMRGRLENATVLLGTATPSLESFQNVDRGKYRLSRLTRRVDDQVMPAMEVVDMAAEAAAHGQPHVFSARLIAVIRETLDRAEQVMLFLNRRGFATQMQCLQCGYVAECNDCSVTYTYHRRHEQLLCHVCGAAVAAPTKCPECNDPGIRYSGLGTERIESIVNRFFPAARVLRMDSDTMTRKESYREALTAFRAGAFDILVGTQMIAKGLHFPNVTLVGIVIADSTLNLPDFRAGERCFQLLVQVAGRAGRGEAPGRVVVQTYTPYHRAVQAALRLDVESFYRGELAVRGEAGLPPISHMILIHVSGKDEDQMFNAATELAREIRPRLPQTARMTEPMPSPLFKRRGKFRCQIMIQSQNVVSLSRGLKRILAQSRPPKDVRFAVDVDPFSLM